MKIRYQYIDDYYNLSIDNANEVIPFRTQMITMLHKNTRQIDFAKYT